MNRAGKSKKYRCHLQAALLALLIATAAAPTQAEPNAESGPAHAPQSSSFSQEEVASQITLAQSTLVKAQDILRFASVKLPSLISDNEKFRAADKSIEMCREESYPAENAAVKLKTEPRRLRDLLRLYMGIRFLQLRCVVLGNQLSGEPNAAALSNQILDLSNKLGQVNLKLQPFVKKVVDAYDASVPDNKLDNILPWQDSGSGFK